MRIIKLFCPIIALSLFCCKVNDVKPYVIGDKAFSLTSDRDSIPDDSLSSAVLTVSFADGISGPSAKAFIKAHGAGKLFILGSDAGSDSVEVSMQEGFARVLFKPNPISGTAVLQPLITATVGNLPAVNLKNFYIYHQLPQINVLTSKDSIKEDGNDTVNVTAVLGKGIYVVNGAFSVQFDPQTDPADSIKVAQYGYLLNKANDTATIKITATGRAAGHIRIFARIGSLAGQHTIKGYLK